MNNTLEVIKDGVLNNGNGIKAIKDELKNSEERLFQQLKSIPISEPEKPEESNPALSNVISVESDDEDEWTKVQRQKNQKEINTLIIGDSMIKDIDPKLMSADGNIFKKSLPGGKIEDLSSKLNTCAFKCKRSVIIHMGSNNITSDDSPMIIASRLVSETEKIKSSTQAPQVIISGIINRNDVKAKSKIAETNNHLKQLCSQKKWKFIDNERIDESCLNSSKLHLNKKGSAYLASNFLKKITPNRRNSERSPSKNGNFQVQSALLTAFIQNFLQNQNQDHR